MDSKREGYIPPNNSNHEHKELSQDGKMYSLSSLRKRKMPTDTVIMKIARWSELSKNDQDSSPIDASLIINTPQSVNHAMGESSNETKSSIYETCLSNFISTTVSNDSDSTSSSISMYKLDLAMVAGAKLRDLKSKFWRLGQPVGKGSFGEVFLASDNANLPVTKQNAKYVAKIEPHSSGPLFVEIHCLMNITFKMKKEMEVTKQQEGIATSQLSEIPQYGIPDYIASGSHYFENERYRFLVLPRFDRDLHSLIKNRRVHQKSLLILAINIITALENLHSHGYCHNDVKAQNIMLSRGNYLEKQIVTSGKLEKYNYEKQLSTSSGNSSPETRQQENKDMCGTRSSNNTNNTMPSANIAQKTQINSMPVEEERIFLIDFGLASKYIDCGVHRPFRMDQRRAHGGTLEFTSRDAHVGAHSRRSDLECLGYNLIYWSQGSLPWMNDDVVQYPEKVKNFKDILMRDVRKELEQEYGEQVPKFLGEFLHQVGQLGFQDRPNYERYRNIFKSEYQKLGYDCNQMKLSSNEIVCTCEIIKTPSA